MTTVTVSPKFQVVIPKDARMSIKPGMQLSVFAYGDRLVLVPVPSAQELRGMCKGMDPTFEREPDREL